MQMNVIKLLSIVRFLRKNIEEVRFMLADNRGSFVNEMPSVAQWAGGDIVLQSFDCSSLMVVLSQFGIKSELTSVNGRKNNAVKFAAKCSDDIIFVLDMALEQKKQKDELQVKDWALRSINPAVDSLLALLSHARGGVFSAGIKAAKRQGDVVANVRELCQQKLTQKQR